MLRLSGHAAYRGEVVVQWLTRARASRCSKSSSERIIFICCCYHSYRVSVDGVHPSLLRSCSFSPPRWYHLQRLSSGTFLVSPLERPNHLSFAFVYLSVIFSTSSLSLILSFLTWFLSVWPHDHRYIFISVTSSFSTWDLITGNVSIPCSIAG